MRAALLVIALAALAGGCGGGPREEARDAVNDLYAASASGTYASKA